MTNSIENAEIAQMASESSPEVLQEFQGLMDDLAAKQRDPSIPAGTVLGEGEIEGMPATWSKQESLHHIDGVALPDRVPLYQWPYNEISLIPTSRVFNRLQRTQNGHRVWSREPFPDALEREWVEKEVPTLDGPPMVKKFQSLTAYESFMRNKHGDQWESMLRQEERDERQADREAQAELSAALIRAAGGTPEAVPTEAPVVSVSEPQVATKPRIPCEVDGCDFQARDARGMIAHMRKQDEAHIAAQGGE